MWVCVNKGCLSPDGEPYLKTTKGVRRTADEYVEGILSGDRVILSQAVTLVESSLPSHFEKAQAIIEKCLPHAGNSIRVGITGVPGAGKSTSIDTFGMHLLEKGHKLAVLAIDPSSELSRGSILGDKTRMERLSNEPNAFIRPSPSAGSLGGVARKTRETIVLCEAAGFDYVFVETVGVGQSKPRSLHGRFFLIQLAGTGDELQGIKRGIMEMADGIVINKADGDNIPKAKMAQRHYSNALHSFRSPNLGGAPRCSPTRLLRVWDSRGVDMVHRYIDFVKQNGYFNRKRKEQSKYWMFEPLTSVSAALQRSRDRPVTRSPRRGGATVSQSSFVAARKALDTYFARQSLPQK